MLLNKLRNLVLLVTLLLFSAPSHAATPLSEIEVPFALNGEIDYLLALADPNQGDKADLSRIENLVDYILSPKQSAALYLPARRSGAPAVFFPFAVRTSLTSILQYGFNPAIPMHAMLPTSVRLSRWFDRQDSPAPLSALAAEYPESTRLVVVRGTEFNENTPDLTTGAYHAYDLDRTLILGRLKGKSIFISLSRQIDTSEIGKKGVVLGADEDWEYLYSGEEGLSHRGLGWARSYMYESCSITLFVQPEDGKELVKCGIFKWLKAGWMGINMVKPRHISMGLERYAQSFRHIMESPALPPAGRLAAEFAKIQNLPLEELRKRARGCLDALLQGHRTNEILFREPFSTLVGENSLADRMDRGRLESVLLVELMKCALGKTCRDEEYRSTPGIAVSPAP